jgi:drug/metabolite transporter (DMT)-like permease
MIILSVIMFGGSFALNDAYRKVQGDSLRTALEFTVISSTAGAVILFVTNKFVFEFTILTFILALISAVCSVMLTYCGFKALATVNLSMYSLFMMLGGMALPFIQGIVFYNEGISLAKIICFILICIALTVTIKKDGYGKNGKYYVLIFILNGMSGVISKFFTESSLPKTSAGGYSLLIAICSAVTAALMLCFVHKEKRQNKKSVLISVSGGIINRIANLILVIALMHVDASVQYPMVTGGVMIVSTFISYFGGNKPKAKELVSVALAFIAMLLLFI